MAVVDVVVVVVMVVVVVVVVVVAIGIVGVVVAAAHDVVPRVVGDDIEGTIVVISIVTAVEVAIARDGGTIATIGVTAGVGGIVFYVSSLLLTCLCS